MKKKPKCVGLTAKQRRFINEYIKDSNGFAAAGRAGLNPGSADKIMAFPHVKEEIKRRLKVVEEKSDVTAAMVVAELWRVANCNIYDLFTDTGALKPKSQLTQDQQRMVSSIEEEELFDGFGQDREQVGVAKKVRLFDKVRALELLAKKFKLLTDKVEIGVSEDLASAIQQARLRVKNAKRR